MKFKNNMKCLLTLVLSLVFASSAMAVKPGPTPPGGHLNITEVEVDLTGSAITIRGEDFDFGPGLLSVTLGEFGSLNVTFDDAFEIVAELPSSIDPGDYLLTVSRGNGQSQNDEYDLTIGADGAGGTDPAALEFYRNVNFTSGGGIIGVLALCDDENDIAISGSCYASSSEGTNPIILDRIVDIDPDVNRLLPGQECTSKSEVFGQRLTAHVTCLRIPNP